MPGIETDPTVFAEITAAAPGAAPGTGRGSSAAALDAFAQRAGPDVAIGSGPEMVRVYAIFAVDPDTRKVHVRVIDDKGRLIRMIPPESVSEMQIGRAHV